LVVILVQSYSLVRDLMYDAKLTGRRLLSSRTYQTSPSFELLFIGFQTNSLFLVKRKSPQQNWYSV